MAGGEEKLLQKNLLAPYEIIAKNTIAQSPFPSKMHLLRIHEQQMLYSTIVPLMNEPKTIRRAVHLYKSLCQWPMNPSCKKLTRKFGFIYTHLCMYFSTCMIHNFILKVSHFISSYLELIKSYCPVAPFKPVDIWLIKCVDPVV